MVQHAGDDLHRNTALCHTGGNGSSEVVPSEMEPQASRQLGGHPPCSVVHGPGPEDIAEHPRDAIRYRRTLCAEERHDRRGERHAVRV